MSATIEALIRDYGILAVFLGCLAEGESVALAGGFFAHQQVLAVLPTFLAAVAGAFLGDTALFVIGRRLSDRPFVQHLRTRRGFSHALALAQSRPGSFVFMSRYAYGMRVAGGIAAGTAGIAWRTFITANLASAIIWAAIFVGFGALFGAGAEALIGEELRSHQRLAAVAALVGASIVAGSIAAWRVRRRSAKA